MNRIDTDMSSGHYGKQASLLIQLCTDHVPLQRYLYRIHKANSPICPSCNTTRESVFHYLMECLARDAEPALDQRLDL